MSDIKSKKTIANSLVFIVSWAVAFVLLAVYCSVCFWLVYLLIDGDNHALTLIDSANYVVIYGILSVITLSLTYLFTRRLARIRFFRYALWALIVGIFLNVLVLAFGVFGLFSASQQAQKALLSGYACTTLADQLDKAQYATVPIVTDLGSGTAFAIGNDNTLLTAYHVIEGAKTIHASYTTGDIDITVLSTAPEFDIALLHIGKSTVSHLTLTSKYGLADPVYVYGYPANTFSSGEASLSSGVVSRVLTNSTLKLNNPNVADGLEMVQTDAAANPGNSGGPIFNKCGVVGVMDAKSNFLQLEEISSEEGINYAISSTTVASRFSLPISDK